MDPYQQLPDPHQQLQQLRTQLGVPAEGPAEAHSRPPVPAGQPQPGLSPAEPQIHPQLIRQDPAMKPRDPLSRPYTLPSGGLLYGEQHNGVVYYSPMRGEQQELLAGAGDGLGATPVLRHVVAQCVDLAGIQYEQLELSDWSALLLHVLALSMGADDIPLYPTCLTCNVQFDGSRPLSQVPCRVLRRAASGDNETWPPANSLDEDEDLRILREMGLDGDKKEDAQQVYVTHAMREPIEAQLSNGQRVGWRYLRLADLIQAEEFAERSQSTTTSPGTMLNRFINARYIATIDGQRVGVLEAMQWTKQAPMPLLGEFRAQIERRSFGYELSPTFKCPNGHSFRQKLPLNGAMFRGRRGATIG